MGRQYSTQQKVDKVWRFIKTFIDGYGYFPTHQEILDGCNISSKSMVSYYLWILVEQKKLNKRKRGFAINTGRFVPAGEKIIPLSAVRKS